MTDRLQQVPPLALEPQITKDGCNSFILIRRAKESLRGGHRRGEISWSIRRTDSGVVRVEREDVGDQGIGGSSGVMRNEGCMFV